MKALRQLKKLGEVAMNQNTSSDNGNHLPAMSPDQYHIFTDMEYEKLRKEMSLFHGQKKQIEDLIKQYNDMVNSIEIIGDFDLTSLQITEKQKRTIHICFHEYRTTQLGYIFERSFDDEDDFAGLAYALSMNVRESPESSFIMYAYNDKMQGILRYLEGSGRLVVYTDGGAYKRAKKRFMY